MKDEVRKLAFIWRRPFSCFQAIQEATASEPLTLEEEYSMQRSWRRDSDKLTFITCLGLHGSPSLRDVVAGLHDQADRMVGDVNLFLTRSDSEDDDSIIGEIELMVATTAHQGQGLGRASLLAFLEYISCHIDNILVGYTSGQSLKSPRLGYLRVKIGKDNNRSIRLFESIGFRKVTEEANYFGEFELRMIGSLKDAVNSAKKASGLEGYQELRYVSQA